MTVSVFKFMRCQSPYNARLNSLNACFKWHNCKVNHPINVCVLRIASYTKNVYFVQKWWNISREIKGTKTICLQKLSKRRWTLHSTHKFYWGLMEHPLYINNICLSFQHFRTLPFFAYIPVNGDHRTMMYFWIDFNQQKFHW